MAGMPTAVLCSARALCIVTFCCGIAVANDPPRSATADPRFVPLKGYRRRPHAGELRPGPKGPGFFRADCDQGHHE